MNRISAILTVLFILVPLVSKAQKQLTASGEYTYYAPSNLTLEQAKAIALERAMNQIIADNFGTVVGVNNTSVVSNINGESSVSFLSIGESEVKGEWLQTKGEPKFDISFQQETMVVKVSVTGVIRELKAAKTPFVAKILRNGTEDRFESEKFSSGDNFYISFSASENGYLAVYLYDGKTVCRLLPLANSQQGSFEVQGGDKYVLFEQKVTRYSAAENKSLEYSKSIYQLTCEQENELNRIYLVFSPNKFSRAVDNPSVETPSGTMIPASLSPEDFQHWLSRCRKHDVEMGVMIKDILISK